MEVQLRHQLAILWRRSTSGEIIDSEMRRLQTAATASGQAENLLKHFDLSVRQPALKPSSIYTAAPIPAAFECRGWPALPAAWKASFHYGHAASR